MPLKYIWGMPQAVSVVGMAHGVLFMAYVGIVFYLAMEHRWQTSMLIKGFLAAVFPLGTFIFEKKYLPTIEELAQKQA
jgi:integral membrane protein